MTLHPMITFSGNCRQAMNFYRDCFGGQLEIKELPHEVRNRLPKKMHHLVIRAKLTTPHFTLFGSDLGPTTAIGRISLLLEGDDGQVLVRVFRQLSSVEHAAIATDEMTLVTDPFGVEWLFSFR